jgi:hypothetical protein
MKRSELAHIEDRVSGLGTIHKFSLANSQGIKIITVLLTNIRIFTEEGKIKIGHGWFKLNKQIFTLSISEGDKISFSCRIKPYFFAPDYEIVQGYGIRKVRELKILEVGKGKNIREFIRDAQDRFDLMNYA